MRISQTKMNNPTTHPLSQSAALCLASLWQVAVVSSCWGSRTIRWRSGRKKIMKSRLLWTIPKNFCAFRVYVHTNSDVHFPTGVSTPSSEKTWKDGKMVGCIVGFFGIFTITIILKRFTAIYHSEHIWLDLRSSYHIQANEDFNIFSFSLPRFPRDECEVLI